MEKEKVIGSLEVLEMGKADFLGTGTSGGFVLSERVEMS